MVEFAAIVVGIFLGAVVSGFAGFAFSAVAGAVLLHVIEPNVTIPLMMACSIISQMITMLTLRRSVRFEANPILLSGGVVGVTLAVALITKLDAQALRWLFGGFLAAYATYLLVKAPKIRMSLSGGLSQSVVGTLGGALGVLTAMPGALPSIWCEVRGCTKEQQRATVQPFIIGMQILALVLLAIKPGGISGTLLYHLLVALPALLLGSWLGAIAFRQIDGLAFRKAILLILIVSGFAMLH
jgi:uncharacterized protein